MNGHKVQHKSNQVPLICMGLGEMGGELAVSQRIVSLLKSKFSVSTYELSAKSAWRLVALLKKLVSVFKYVSPFNGKTTVLYTTESFVVGFLLVRKFVSFGLAKQIIIFHYHGTKATPYTASYKNPAKVILAVLDHYLLYCLLIIFEKMALTFSDAVIVPDKRTRQILKRKSPTFLLPSYVDTTLFLPKRQSATLNKKTMLKVGYIGRMSKEKGVFELVEACRLLSSSVSCSVTHIRGINDHLLEELKEYSTKYGVDLKTHYNLSPKQVASLIHSLDCVVLASYSEHLPLALLESLACGVPVFATDVGDCYQILSRVDKKLQLKVGSAEEISKKMSWWKTQSIEYKKKISQRCRVVALDYSTTLFDRRVGTLFSRLLATPVGGFLSSE